MERSRFVMFLTLFWNHWDKKFLTTFWKEQSECEEFGSCNPELSDRSAHCSNSRSQYKERFSPLCWAAACSISSNSSSSFISANTNEQKILTGLKLGVTGLKPATSVCSGRINAVKRNVLLQSRCWHATVTLSHSFSSIRGGGWGWWTVPSDVVMGGYLLLEGSFCWTSFCWS